MVDGCRESGVGSRDEKDRPAQPPTVREPSTTCPSRSPDSRPPTPDSRGKRVGVFVCDCGSNIAATVDVPAVVEDARKQEGVVHAEEGKWICSVDFLSRIQNAVKEQKLDRVVVACCTPRTHEPTFKATVKEAGLNPFLLEFVSIREQSSWVHKFDRAEATRVAKDLVRMGIAKALLLEPAECVSIPVGKDALIIGGGLAGMSAALGLAEQGIRVVLVEKSERLGGLLNKMEKIAPHAHSSEKLAKDLAEKVTHDPNIRLMLDSQVEDIMGYVGNYTVTVGQQAAEDRSSLSKSSAPRTTPVVYGAGSRQKGATTDAQQAGSGQHETHQFKISTIIAATGMEELRPAGFGYGTHPNVMTLLEFEQGMKAGFTPGDVAFIGCVESRNEKRGCCNVGCLGGFQAASAVKERHPDSQVGFFYRDITLEGTGVASFDDAVRQQGLRLYRFADDAYPTVEQKDGKLIVSVRDILSGADVHVKADTVVLITGFRGTDEAGKLKGLLKVSSDNDGFF